MGLELIQKSSSKIMVNDHSYDEWLPEQLKPFPSVNGDRHVQVKLSVSKPSLSQTALISQGSLRQGSGTIRITNSSD